jgi:hypothetical protein
MKITGIDIRGALSILIIGLLAICAAPQPGQATHLLSIRHGVHSTYDRVVFDLSSETGYSIDDRQSGRSIYVTIQGVDSQETMPDIEMSPNPKVVANISRMLDGTYQISILTPVTVKSFTIANSTFRIVVDLYPKEEAPSHSSVPVPTIIPIEEREPEVASRQPKAEVTKEQAVARSPDPKQLKSSPEPEPSPASDPVSPSHDLNSLYNLKQTALKLQADGELDSASVQWEEYLSVAKELQKDLVSKDQLSANVNRDRGSGKSGIYSLIGKAVFLYLPFALFAIAVIIWVINRYSFIAHIRKLGQKSEPEEESNTHEEEPPPVKKQEAPEETLPEPIEEPKPPEVEPVEEPKEEETEEPVDEVESQEEPKTEEIIDEMPEESTLEELFGVGVDSAAEEEKVKRILELAGEEKSIAEIAEEMGIGEDEVRLVLDLQGYGVPADDGDGEEKR